MIFYIKRLAIYGICYTGRRKKLRNIEIWYSREQGNNGLMDNEFMLKSKERKDMYYNAKT